MLTRGSKPGLHGLKTGHHRRQRHTWMLSSVTTVLSVDVIMMCPYKAASLPH
jgi:hypothetical protein